MTSARDKITQARINLQDENPFFSYLVMQLDIREDITPPKGCAMGVNDKGDMIYREDSVMEMTIPELKGVLCHEVMHLGLEHTIRRGNRDRKIWNYATDISINNMLRKDGFELPKGMWDDNMLEMSSEEIYDEIYDSQEKGRPPKREGDGRGPKSDDDDSQSQNGDDNEEDDNDSGDSGGSGDDDDDEDDDDTGDGSDDDDDDDEDDEEPISKDSEAKDGEMHDDNRIDSHPEYDGKDKEKRDNLEDWSSKLKDASEFARKQGQGLNSYEQVLETVEEDTIDWRDMLWRFVSSEIMTDYTWTKPSKKNAVINKNGDKKDIYLPGTDRENLNIVVVIDTSGSIANSEIQRFKSEVSAIAKQFDNLDVTIIEHTSDVTDTFELRDYNLQEFLDKPTQDRGGTNHLPVFKWIEENRPNAEGVICMTDGYTTTPESFRIPTVWVLTTEDDNRIQFGTVTHIHKE